VTAKGEAQPSGRDLFFPGGAPRHRFGRGGKRLSRDCHGAASPACRSAAEIGMGLRILSGRRRDTVNPGWDGSSQRRMFN